MLIKAKTTREYLHSLHKDRRIALKAVRNVILKNLPEGYKETTQYGMISYVVPLSLYPDGYLGKKDVPLPYAALASQKNHMAVYLMNIYAELDEGAEQWFRKAFKASGKKVDVGKSASDSENLMISRLMLSAKQ